VVPDRIVLAQPDLRGNELRYVEECVTSGWVSSIGRFIGEFESEVAELAGTRFAVATNNGTTALHLALVALGIGPGDEVIVPTLTYVATANAVTYCGAIPVLADVQPSTGNLDPVDFARRITSRTRAVIPVHLYGVPADMDEIGRIADAASIAVVEDAAEAHGARFGGAPVGSLGSAGVFSFFGNKIVSTGEGGAVTTDDPELADRLRLYRGQGMDPQRRYRFPVIGYNYRMTNIQAALGLAQLERFDELLRIRTAIADQYSRRLAALAPKIELTATRSDVTAVPWLQNIWLGDASERVRDELMAHLDAEGIDSRPVFYPMHVLPPYRTDERFPVADDWSVRGISLPLHTALRPEDVDRVCDVLERWVAAQ
jgi:perosamine synthetase